VVFFYVDVRIGSGAIQIFLALQSLGASVRKPSLKITIGNEPDRPAKRTNAPAAATLVPRTLASTVPATLHDQPGADR
jgi:hypothetical protein